MSLPCRKCTDFNSMTPCASLQMGFCLVRCKLKVEIAIVMNVEFWWFCYRGAWIMMLVTSVTKTCSSFLWSAFSGRASYWVTCSVELTVSRIQCSRVSFLPVNSNNVKFFRVLQDVKWHYAIIIIIIIIIIINCKWYVPGGSGTTIHSTIQYYTIQYTKNTK
jgi:hypothetical protein